MLMYIHGGLWALFTRQAPAAFKKALKELLRYLGTLDYLESVLSMSSAVHALQSPPQLLQSQAQTVCHGAPGQQCSRWSTHSSDHI